MTNLGNAPPRPPRSVPDKSSTKAASQANSSEHTNRVTKSAAKLIGPPRPISGPCVSAENADKNLLPSFDDSVENVSALDIPKWGDNIDNEGTLAGLQSSNWKARVAALSQIAEFYRNTDLPTDDSRMHLSFVGR